MVVDVPTFSCAARFTLNPPKTPPLQSWPAERPRLNYSGQVRKCSDCCWKYPVGAASTSESGAKVMAGSARRLPSHRYAESDCSVPDMWSVPGVGTRADERSGGVVLLPVMRHGMVCPSTKRRARRTHHQHATGLNIAARGGTCGSRTRDTVCLPLHRAWVANARRHLALRAMCANARGRSVRQRMGVRQLRIVAGANPSS
jgi:hypothetical protein